MNQSICGFGPGLIFTKERAMGRGLLVVSCWPLMYTSPVGDAALSSSSVCQGLNERLSTSVKAGAETAPRKP